MANPMLIDCPKCQGDMGARRVGRYGDGPAFLGVLMLGGGVVATLAGLVLLVVGTVFEKIERGLPNLYYATELEKLEGLPPEVVTEFERTRNVSDETLAELSDELRTDVEEIVDAARDQPALFAPLFDPAGAARMGRLMVAVCVPSAFVGFFLSRKRKLWLCLDCGHTKVRYR